MVMNTVTTRPPTSTTKEKYGIVTSLATEYDRGGMSSTTRFILRNGFISEELMYCRDSRETGQWSINRPVIEVVHGATPRSNVCDYSVPGATSMHVKFPDYDHDWQI